MDLVIILQLLKNGVVLGLLYGLFAYGLSMVLAATGIFHLAILTAMTAGAYGLWWGLTQGLVAPIAVLLALALAGFVGLITELLIYRPLRSVRANDLVMLVASLTVLSLGQALFAISFGSDAKAIPPNDFTSWRLTLGGVYVTTFDLLIIVSSLLVFVVLYLLQRFSKMGLAFRALGDNPDLARMKGVRVNQTYVALFIITSVVAGLVGALIGSQQSASPTMGFNLLIMAVIALAIGGVGNMTGAMLAGLGVGLAESLLAYFTNVSIAHIVLFTALVLLVVLRPQGLRIHATREA